MQQVPAECTLPTAEQPLRVAEFDDVFSTLLVGVERTSSTTVVLDLRGGPAEEDGLRDLIARESACCSFFRFTLTRAGADRMRLHVGVPEAQADVLDGITTRAITAQAATARRDTAETATAQARRPVGGPAS